MPDFWEKMAESIWRNDRKRYEVKQREEAQKRGDRSSSQGGGGEAAASPPSATNSALYDALKSTLQGSSVTHEPGADAPLYTRADDPGPSPSLSGPEPIYVGWRWWTIDDEDMLRSLTYAYQWEGPTLHADEKPTPSNRHGIYSMRREAPAAYRPSLTERAYGQIEYSGRVIIGEDGYRGEVATIRSLWLEEEWIELPNDGMSYREWGTWPRPELIRRLEERYQCPVKVVPPADHVDIEFPFKVQSIGTQMMVRSAISSLGVQSQMQYYSPGLRQSLGQVMGNSTSQQNAYMQAIWNSLNT